MTINRFERASGEEIAAVFEQLGVGAGPDVLKVIDAAEDVVRPVMDDERVWEWLTAGPLG